MALIDHRRERDRLAATYAAMSELDLTDLARDQRSLTDDALDALESEFSKRGIPFERENLETAEQQNVKLVALRRFLGLPQALVAFGPVLSARFACGLERTISLKPQLYSRRSTRVKRPARELKNSIGLPGFKRHFDQIQSLRSGDIQ
jgi:hypothetical protein